MKRVTIENTNLWRIDSVGNGLMYEITCKQTGDTGLVQGEDATLWRADYDQMQVDHGTPGTRASRFAWNVILSELCAAYIGDRS